jgi:dihydroflavonol-4-reductase
MLVQWFCLRRLPAFANGGGHSFCDVRDVARAHVAALENISLTGRYITAGKNLKSELFYRTMSEQIGSRMPVGISPKVFFIATALMDGVSVASCGLWKNPVHRAFARSLPLYYWGDSARAGRDLNYRCRPLEQTIRDTVVDFVHRGMLPNEFRYVEAITEENRAALLMLKQLAQSHLHRSHLIARLDDIIAACHNNHSLNEALNAVVSSGHYDPDRGRIIWRGVKPVNALRKLRGLLDYCYYSSDEFRARVT